MKNKLNMCSRWYITWKEKYNHKMPAFRLKKHILLSISQNLFPVIMGLIGAGIIILSTSRFNLGFTPDSVYYISTARNIASGSGITHWVNSPSIIQPPGYPIILAEVNYVFNIDPLLSARYVNALLFGLIIYLSGLLFRKHLKSSPTLVLLGTAYVLVSITLVDNSLKAWSEPLFICFILLFLLFSERYLEKRNLNSLVLLSMISSFASLTRYLGIVLILTGIVLILFFNRDNLATKFRHFLLFGSISILPITAFLIRNYSLSGSLVGYNPTGIGRVTLFQGIVNIFHVVNTMFINFLSWFLPERIINFTLLLFLLSLTIGFFAGLEYKENWKKLSNLLQVYPILLFVTFYTGSYLLLYGPVNYYETRYLSPVFVPIILLLLILCEKLVKPMFDRLYPKYVNILFGAVVAVGLIYPAYIMIQQTSDQMEQGSGYTSETWKNSETIHYLLQHRTLESECTIYTNGNDAIYLLTSLNTKQGPRNNLGYTDISQMKGLWPQESKVCLVWFDNLTRNYLFSPEELMSIVRVEKVTRFQDGAIYYFSRK